MWTDAVYLSTDATWDINDTLIGRETQIGPLGVGQTHNSSQTIPLPAINLGQYYVLVRTDVRNGVRETNETNNLGASTTQTNVDVTNLPLGTTINTTLNANQERYFKTNTPAGETVKFSVDGQDGTSNELFTLFGSMASRSNYDFQFSRPNEADQETIVPSSQAGNYYNLARADYVPPLTPTDVAIKAEVIPFSITSVSPNRIGDNGQVTITLKGAKFQEGATVKLVQGSTELTAAKVIVIDQSTVKARFLFTNAPHGIYDLTLTNPNNQSVLSSQSVTIENTRVIDSNMSLGGNLRIRRSGNLNIYGEIKNLGNVDIQYITVIAEIEGDFIITNQRPDETFPRKADFPNIDWLNEPLTNSSDELNTLDSFIVRDLAPESKINFSIQVKELREDKQFRVFSIDKTRDVFWGDLITATEEARETLIASNSTIPNPIFRDSVVNAEIWWELHRQAFITQGILDIQGSQYNDDIGKSVAKKFQESTKSDIEGGLACTFGCIAKEVYCSFKAVEKKCYLFPVSGPGAIYLGTYCALRIIYKKYKCLKELICCLDICNNINQPPPPPPPPRNCSWQREGCKWVLVCVDPPIDPNDKKGPTGFGESNFIANNEPLPYTINFENVPTATAAASRVRVTDQLDANLDWRTFRLKEIGFGKYRFNIPDNKAFYQGRIQLGAELGNVFADVTAGIDIATGRVTWTLQAIDPTTGEPPNNANYGLLPPNNEANDGQGYVTYTVKPKITATTGTVIRNNATIIFDTEEPITTNTVSNTLDADLPTSAVNALPPTSPNNFTVSWTGSDVNGGSGLQSYDIWFSANNGAYQPFLSGTTETSATFEGQPNTTYKFYSIARDNSGNVESAPTTHDAITVTSDGTNNPVPTLSSINPNSATAGGSAFTLTVNGTNFINSSVVNWNGQPRPTTLISPTKLNVVIVAADIANAGTANITVVNPTPGGGTSGALPFNIIQSTTQADLRLTMVDSGDPVLRGQNVVYQITVTNLGPNTANNVVVQDEILSLGAISTITSSVGTCTITRGDLANCNLGNMLNQATATITVTTPTNQSVGNRIRNYASVNSATPDPNTDNNSKLEETSIGASVSGYGANGYRYLQLSSGQTPPTNFGEVTFNDSAWSIGQAAFGNGSTDCSPIAQINTNWLENTRLLMRKKIILSSTATNVRIAAGIDDDVEKVFFNGVQIGGPDLIGGCPVLDSVFYEVPQSLIQNGENVVAFQVFDRGGVSFFDMRVLSEQSIPTFAETGISGRVTASNGRIFKNAILTLTSTDETVTKIHQTNPFGYYRFMNVPTGKIYLLSIESKHHTFTPNSIILNVFDKLENVNFVANP